MFLAEGGGRMNGKKYLLTESDIRKIKDLECGWCADNAGGHFNCADASNAEQERFLEAHEYRERTCAVTGIEYDKTMGACFALSCGHSTWHDGEGNAPNFCQDCGAKVNHRGATDREVSG